MVTFNKYKLKELIKINNGKDYKHLSAGDIPVYGSGGLMSNVSACIHDGEAILLPRKGSLGNIMYVNGPFWTVDTMYWAVVNSDIAYPKYLFYYLSLLDLSHRDSGSTLPSMTFDAYYSLVIDLPPMNVQKKVGDYLFLLSKKMENNNAIISELESMAKDIYDYWFVQFDFPDENGKPYKSSGGKMVWNEELKREIPEGWKCVSIDSCCDIVDCLHSQKPDYVYENNSCYLLQTENLVNNGLIDLSNPYYVSFDSYKTWTTKIEVCEGDLLITNAGRAGCVYRIPSNVVAGIGRNMTAIRPLSIPSVYFYYYMIGHDVQKQIKENTDNGAFFSSFNVRSIKKLNILFPHERILSRAENILSSIRTKSEKAYQENAELTSLRDFLLPLLMNGQVKIGDVSD